MHKISAFHKLSNQIRETRISGGIRKLRYALDGQGKSGGVRVFYFDYPRIEHLFLMAVIKKGEQENLTKAERNDLKKFIAFMIKDYELKKKKAKQ